MRMWSVTARTALEAPATRGRDSDGSFARIRSFTRLQPHFNRLTPNGLSGQLSDQGQPLEPHENSRVILKQQIGDFYRRR